MDYNNRHSIRSDTDEIRRVRPGYSLPHQTLQSNLVHAYDKTPEDPRFSYQQNGTFKM